MNRWRSFALLTADAVRDGLRNRVGLFALVFALLVGLLADRCTGLGFGSLVLNGREFDLRDGARLAGPLIYATSALLLVLIAAFLASDGLARPLSEGTAAIWLARPVGRGSYALSRLAGSLGITLAAGWGVLLVVTALLHLRFGLSLGPGVTGLLIFAADAWVVGAAAMTLALLLPRVVALGAVLLLTQLLVLSNVLATAGSTSGGLLESFERWGPPLGTALVYALSPWFSASVSTAEWIDVCVRLLAWAAGTSALLVLLFRRLELSS